MDTSLMQQLSGPGVVMLENAAGDTAAISLYGGHVLSWATRQSGEQLYCSALATTDNGKSIRGGVPVCFPQFSGFGHLPKHGFVRTMVWSSVGEIVTGKDKEVAKASFTVADNVATRALWPHAFSLQLDVFLKENMLEVALTVTNTDTQPLAFSAALHTYLAVDDVRQSTVAGLHGSTFIDTTRQPHATSVQTQEVLTVPGEVDNIYYDAPKQLTLRANTPAQLHIAMEGFNDTVIWNPGPDLARSLSDMEDTDWLNMLCIEAVQFQHPVVLTPAAQWQGVQILRAE